MESLTFIIPAYNDEATIETVVNKTVAVGRKLAIPFRLLVCNDASRDQTARKLTHLEKQYSQLTVIHHAINKGYGQTIKELYQKARSTWLFSLPGDYQIDPGELEKLWPERSRADLILGWRKVRHDASPRIMQSAIYNTILAVLFGTNVHDVNSVRLMKTSVMKSVRLASSSAFVDAELIIRAKRKGFRIMEIPIAHRARAGVGASGGKLSTIVPTIVDMILFVFRI